MIEHGTITLYDNCIRDLPELLESVIEIEDSPI